MPFTLPSNVFSMRTYSCSRDPSTGSRELRPAPPGRLAHDVSAAKRPVSARLAPVSSVRSDGFIARRFFESAELMGAFGDRYRTVQPDTGAVAGGSSQNANRSRLRGGKPALQALATGAEARTNMGREERYSACRKSRDVAVGRRTER